MLWTTEIVVCQIMPGRFSSAVWSLNSCTGKFTRAVDTLTFKRLRSTVFCVWDYFTYKLGMQGVKFLLFPIFSAAYSYFSYFLAILHVTCISHLPFQGFLFNFSFFLSGAHQLFLKNFQPHFFGIILYTYNYVELNRLQYSSFGGLGWLKECWETMLRYRKKKKFLHQIINKYMNKVPIFSYFSGIANSYFPIFLTIPITWRPGNVKKVLISVF